MLKCVVNVNSSHFTYSSKNDGVIHFFFIFQIDYFHLRFSIKEQLCIFAAEESEENFLNLVLFSKETGDLYLICILRKVKGPVP